MIADAQDRGFFRGALLVEQIPPKHMVDLSPVYLVRHGMSFHAAGIPILRVPEGFDTDMASIPRTCVMIGIAALVLLGGVTLPSWVWLLALGAMWAFPRSGSYNRSCVLHDWLYWALVREGLMTRKRADEIFRVAMIADHVDPVRRWVMWAMVRAFGGVFRRIMDGVWERREIRD